MKTNKLLWLSFYLSDKKENDYDGMTDLFQEPNEEVVSSQPSAGSTMLLDTSHTGLPTIPSDEQPGEQLPYTSVSMAESNMVPLVPETMVEDFPNVTLTKQGN